METKCSFAIKMKTNYLRMYSEKFDYNIYRISIIFLKPLKFKFNKNSYIIMYKHTYAESIKCKLTHKQ